MPKQFTPRTYQEGMIRGMIERKRVNIWARMGAGKTVASLTALSALKMMGEVTKPALILGPRRVVNSVWSQETQEWEHLSHLKILVIKGTAKQRAKLLANVYEYDAVAITYELLPWLCEFFENGWPFEMVIADESTKLKSFRLGGGAGRRAKAIGRLAHSNIDRWINLTGTPSPNELLDLWGQQWFIDRGERLGRTYGAYRDKYFSPPYGNFGKWNPFEHSMERIQNLLSDCTIHVDPRGELGVDEPITSVVYVELPVKANQIYRNMMREMYAEVNGQPIEAFSAGVKSNKLLQIASGGLYLEAGKQDYVALHEEKLDALEEVFSDHDSPLLVGYQFKFELDMIMKRFPWARELKGDQEVKDWNAGKIKMLLVHPASAGHGLSLQHGGHRVCFYSVGWSSEHHDQLIERLGPTRQKQSGYDREVYLYYIQTRGTIDVQSFDVVQGKITTQEALMKAMKETLE